MKSKFSVALFTFIILFSIFFELGIIADAKGNYQTVYVVNKIMTKGDLTDGSWTYNFYYNENGLIVKWGDLHSGEKEEFLSDSYVYDSKMDMISNDCHGYGQFFCKRNKKGKVIGMVNDKGRICVRYKYDNNERCIEQKTAFDPVSFVPYKGNYVNTKTHYTYNEDDELEKEYFKGELDDKMELISTYSYDDRNHCTENEGKYGTVTFENEYKNERLVKRKIKKDTKKATERYSYKKMSVPKKLVSKIKRQQQWVYLNGTIDFGYGPDLEAYE